MYTKDCLIITNISPNSEQSLNKKLLNETLREN